MKNKKPKSCAPPRIGAYLLAMVGDWPDDHCEEETKMVKFTKGDSKPQAVAQVNPGVRVDYPEWAYSGFVLIQEATQKAGEGREQCLILVPSATRTRLHSGNVPAVLEALNAASKESGLPIGAYTVRAPHGEIGAQMLLTKKWGACSVYYYVPRIMRGAAQTSAPKPVKAKPRTWGE